MADNVPITAGSGTPVATDEIGGAHYQRVKLTQGAEGVAADVNSSAPLFSTPVPNETVGLSMFRSLDLDEGAVELVKGSAGQLYGMWVTNRAATTRFVKFYNATSGNVGTLVPVITIGIPGNSSDNVAGLFSTPHGIFFSVGIAVGCSTGFADADTGAPNANDLIINIFYK